MNEDSTVTIEEIKEVLLEFSMTPLDKGESVSPFVSRSLDIIDKSGLDYKLNPMGTVVEGTWEQVLEVLGHCFDKMSSDWIVVKSKIKDYSVNFVSLSEIHKLIGEKDTTELVGSLSLENIQTIPLLNKSEFHNKWNIVCFFVS